MGNIEIRKKLDTIFENEVRSPKRQYRAKYGSQVCPTTSLIVDNPKRFELLLPNLDLLLRLHSSISHNKEDSDAFFSYLKQFFSSKNYDYKTTAYLAFEALAELKSLEEAFSSWISKKKKEKELFINEYRNILEVVSSKLRYESSRFSDNELGTIEEYINKMLIIRKNHMTLLIEECQRLGIPEQISEIRYLRLKSELEVGVNPEINADKEKVTEKINRFGFSDELSGALNKIDEYYWNTTSDKFDWAMANSLLRTFLTQLLKEISREISGKTGDKIIMGKSELNSFKSYIKKQLLLDDEENKLINALIGITNSEGAHTLITEKEYSRLCKNMIIELSLLLMSKLESFLEK